MCVFPTTARYWKVYIEQEMKYRNYERVEKLFQRCLVKILNIDLWKLYLTYVKETKAGLSTHKLAFPEPPIGGSIILSNLHYLTLLLFVLGKRWHRRTISR